VRWLLPFLMVINEDQQGGQGEADKAAQGPAEHLAGAEKSDQAAFEAEVGDEGDKDADVGLGSPQYFLLLLELMFRSTFILPAWG